MLSKRFVILVLLILKNKPIWSKTRDCVESLKRSTFCLIIKHKWGVPIHRFAKTRDSLGGHEVQDKIIGNFTGWARRGAVDIVRLLRTLVVRI